MAANAFDDRIRFGSLYEIYGALLTEKQRQCLELYFCEDYSLAEVAEEMQVSRQAIHDLLRRVEQGAWNRRWSITKRCWVFYSAWRIPEG